jgi:acyl-CoA reductase-like NAD-dependent aldehyde dehydrogenase
MCLTEILWTPGISHPFSWLCFDQSMPESVCNKQLTAGVMNVVHGTHDVVNRICDAPAIKAVAFVGSDAAGRNIYTRASAAGKRVQV